MARYRLFRPAFVLCIAALVTAAAMGARAEAPSWSSVADVERVEVITHDEGGDVRETVVWLIVVDGEGYIRTGNTRWGDNLVRDPELVLRIEDAEYPLRVEFVEDDARREQIVAAFREKYGFTDSFMNIFRGSRPKIMRLLPR